MYLACTEASTGFINKQPAVTMVHFCDSDKLASEQLAPNQNNVAIHLARAKLEIGSRTLNASPALTNMEAAQFFQHTVRRVA